MKTGAELISDERERQIKVEGWTAEHDSQHETEEFIKAALSYLMVNVESKFVDHKYMALLGWWPWDKEFFKPKDIKSDLVRAGALIAAALDRLQTEKVK